MADSTNNNIEKVASTVPETQPDPPPVAKEPTNAGGESMEPSSAPNTATGAENATSSESTAQINATTTSKEELAKKLDEADKLASQPEKPVDTAPAPAQPTAAAAASDTAAADAPSLPNGNAKEPRPVTMEEVRDQDMPASASTQAAEMAGALPVKEPETDAPKADPTEAAPKLEKKAKADTRNKRKAGEVEATNGGAAHEEPSEDAPVEKKQKSNGATTNDAPKKVGRPKKSKKAAPSVGRTARRTRSQGAAE
ncbi:hypothetical protein GGR54DRAFT_91462 [Hypoxylon sp. NC1633]|nr:hypothetical protein GGR54DRAFT_91462 [Hypoxylon sp. NC1633]